MADRGAHGSVIGIDLGTSRIKGASYRLDGSLVRLVERPLTTSRLEEGWVEQDPNEWWSALREILGELGSASALAITGQINGVVLVDAEGSAIRPAIVWADTRAACEAAELGVDATSPIARYTWLAAHEPKALATTRWWLLPRDFLNLRLTGMAVSDPISALGLTDGLAYRADLPDRLLACLPPLQPATHLLGEWEGTIVSVGCMDTLAAIYASCRIEPGTGIDVAGTSETVGIISAHGERWKGIRRAFPIGNGSYLHAGPTQAGGGSVAWAREALTPDLSVEEFYSRAATAPPGSNGLVFLPYLQGERAPIWDPTVRGCLYGLASTHRRADLCRAVLEGVAYSIRHTLETVESVLPERASRVVVSGGPAASSLWNQIKADVLGRPFERAEAREPGTLGAAMVAAVTARFYGSLAEAQMAMLRQGALSEPTEDASVRARYDALFERYLSLSGMLRAIPSQ